MTILAFVIGFVIGAVIEIIYYCIMNRAYGHLRIDHSNPKKDVYRLDINDLDGLAKKRKIVLKIDNDADLS